MQGVQGLPKTKQNQSPNQNTNKTIQALFPSPTFWVFFVLFFYIPKYSPHFNGQMSCVVSATLPLIKASHQ